MKNFIFENDQECCHARVLSQAHVINTIIHDLSVFCFYYFMLSSAAVQGQQLAAPRQQPTVAAENEADRQDNVPARREAEGVEQEGTRAAGKRLRVSLTA